MSNWLSLHIIGAIVSGVVAVFALVKPPTPAAAIKRLLYLLLGLFLFQVGTGLLTAVTLGKQVLYYCDNLLLYLTLFIAVELVLIRRLRRQGHYVSSAPVWYSSGLSVALTAFALALGY